VRSSVAQCEYISGLSNRDGFWDSLGGFWDALRAQIAIVPLTGAWEKGSVWFSLSPKELYADGHRCLSPT